MFFKQPIRDRHKPLIPPVITGLVSSDKKNHRPERIERVECAERLAAALRAQLSHSPVARSLYLRAMRKAQCRSKFSEQSNRMSNVILLAFGQGVPPRAELVREFDFPSHSLLCCIKTMLSTAYRVRLAV